MLSLKPGSSVAYFTEATEARRENYYTGAVAEGEPPGRWYGVGAARLGLSGLVDPQDMRAVYEHFVDPSDPGFTDPDRWEAASKLGHTGYRYRTEDEIYEALLDAEPGADAARRDELRVQAGRQATQHNRSFIDATFSVPKSVTVAHAAFEAQEVKARRAGNGAEERAWGWMRRAVEDAIWAGNNAMLDYLSQHAGYSRIGHHGGAGGRWIDAHDWTVASFFQHDSRDKDPQCHIHNPILNRVVCADGVVRALDSKALHIVRPGAAAVGERTMHERLAATLGMASAMRPDGKARELLGVPQEVMDLLSSRRRAIGPRQAALIEAYTARYGHEPSPAVRDRLARQAMQATRKSKSRTESVEARLDRVEAQMNRDLGTGFAHVAYAALARAGQAPEPARWSVREVVETALAAVQAKHSTWAPAQLTQEIDNALPDNLGVPDGAKVAQLLDWLTAKGLELAVALDAPKPGDDALAPRFRLADGRSAFDAPCGSRYVTPGHLDTERLLVAAALSRDARAADSRAARRFVERLAGQGIELGADQAAVLTGVLTSGARVESLVGPAGAGKSFVLGALARAWSDPAVWTTPDQPAPPAGGPSGEGRVFGLATTQIAAEVLAAEGISAANTTGWLGAQTRLAENRGIDGDRRWALRREDLVVIDESSMADTAAVAAVYRRVRAAGAKLLLVGDHKQLGAVGAGGLMELIAHRGASYELTEVRRFHQHWERAASLRLRAGDITALDDYHRNGRILDAGTTESAEDAAARGWLADTLAGKHSILVVDTNEQAARINARMRGELVTLGRVAEHGVPLGREGTYAGVGDIVQARRLAWELAGYAGNKSVPVTRRHYRVQQVRDDGSIVVAPIVGHTGPGGERREVLGEAVTLPASYVAEDLTLGYAATVHAAESLTVDTGHCVATPRTPANALYPAATRGREHNTLYVVTQYAPDDAEPDELANAVTRNPRAVLATILEDAEAEQTALATAQASAEEAVSVRTAAERLAVVADIAVAERTTLWLDELAAAGELTIAQRRRIAAEDGGSKLAPILRRIEIAGHDPRAALNAAVTGGRGLDDARQVSSVLVHRLTHNRTFDPAGARFADWAPATEDPALAEHLRALTAAADARCRQLGEQLANNPPAWAVEALGPPPTEQDRRAEWVARAGVVAGHRELVDHDDPHDVIGRPPKPGQIEAYASWRAAWRALGRPDTDTAEQNMTDGQLRMRVRAYQRELPWAPRRVANELAGTIHAAEHHRQTATLKAAEADAAATDTERERLAAEAEQATRIADALDAEIETLRAADQAWALWVAHTAGTRAAADLAQAELTARRASDPIEDDRVTADEWEASRQDTERAEEPYRRITETDLADDRHTFDIDAAKDQLQPADTIDLRELAAGEQPGADEDTVRVPTPAETNDTVRRACRALEEMHAREIADAAAEADEQARAERVARWQTDDTAVHQADDTADRDPSLDTSGPEPSLAAEHGAGYE